MSVYSILIIVLGAGDITMNKTSKVFDSHGTYFLEEGI